MTQEIQLLKTEAEYYCQLLHIGAVDYDTAKEHIMPYLNAVNAKAKDLAKKYKVTAKTVSFSSYIR